MSDVNDNPINAVCPAPKNPGVNRSQQFSPAAEFQLQ